MDSDDKDAKEPRKKASIVRRAASLIKRAIKKEQSSTDSGDIYRPFGVFNEKTRELEPGLSNPDLSIKSMEDDSLPSIPELWKMAYSLKSVGDPDPEHFIFENLKKILVKKSADDESVAKETDSVKPEEVRPPLYVNLELDSILHLAQYNETAFPTQYEEDPTLTGAGLINLGSTCFMNSVLQCLVHTVPLYEAILSENHSLRCDCEGARSKGFCLSCYIRHIFRSSTTGRRVIAPMALANNLKYISDRFSKGQQDDAHEFLTMLWTRLKEWHVQDSPYESFIKRVFGGLSLIKLTCCGCDNYSESRKEIYDVQLPIQDTDNLIEAILSNTVGEVGYSCEKCRKEEGAILRIMFDEVPSIATFQLKRFDNEMKKIEKHVFFPLELNLLPFTTAGDGEMCYGRRSAHDKMKYELYAVIVHRGSTLERGHYYCFIQISPDEWIRFDDDRVSRVDKNEVLSQQAYILFYAKQGTPWFKDSIIAQDSTSSAIEIEASTSPDSLKDDGVYSVDDPSTSSQAEATEIDNGKRVVYSVDDPSTSSRAPAASEVDGGRHGVRLAPIEEEGESEDLEARRAETEEE